MSELPESWAQVPLAAITSEVTQRVPSDEETIHYIDIGSVNRTTKRIETPQKLLGKDAPSRARKQVAAGDTLVSMTRPNLNAVALVPKELDGEIASTGFDVLRPIPGIDPRWINYLVRTEKFVDSMSALVQGALYPAVRSKDVRAYVVPLAPAAEQTRIANQLDTLLTRIQSCNDRFDAIPSLLKRFRNSVISAAVSGRLTSDLRREDAIASSSTASSLWQIPASWRWARADEVTGFITKGTTPSKERMTSGSGEIPYIKVYNLGFDGLLDFSVDPTFVDSTTHSVDLRRSITLPGDVLMNIVGPPLGKVAIVPDSYQEWNINQAIARFRPVPGLLSPYLAHCLMSTELIAHAVSQAKATVGQLNLTLEICRALPIPMPPEKEQAEIVRCVQALFVLAGRIEARATAARTQAQRLSSLVLSKAFRGELVQQDPQDEPASVLLQRLAATQPAKAKASRGRPHIKTQELFATPEGGQPDAASLPDGVWAAPDVVDEHAVTVMLVAVLQAWSGPMPQMQARLAAVLCLQPRQMTAVLPAEQAAQWQRLVGPVADLLPTQVARLQPATDSAWRKALLGMRARGDLVEEGSGPQATWALGPGAGQIETAGWPEGRAGWVVAYLRAQGAEAILPLLEPLTVEFVHARAA